MKSMKACKPDNSTTNMGDPSSRFGMQSMHCWKQHRLKSNEWAWIRASNDRIFTLGLGFQILMLKSWRCIRFGLNEGANGKYLIRLALNRTEGQNFIPFLQSMLAIQLLVYLRVLVSIRCTNPRNLWCWGKGIEGELTESMFWKMMLLLQSTWMKKLIYLWSLSFWKYSCFRFRGR